MAHDVFISYSTKDKTIADAVCAKLEENKIRVWIAPRDVAPGSNFAASIIHAINTCKVFILIWSANTSEHILNEINQAFDQGITIIPFRLQDIQPTDEMRYYFGRTHWLDAINPPLEKHITTLKDTVLVNLTPERQAAIHAQKPEQEPGLTSLKQVPAIDETEVLKPSVIPSHREKARESIKEIPPAGATSATRLLPTQSYGKDPTPRKKQAALKSIWIWGSLLAILVLGIGGAVFWLNKISLPSNPTIIPATVTEVPRSETIATVTQGHQPETIIVNSTEDSGPGTLRQALLDAQAGDIITFDPGIFPPDRPTTIYPTSIAQDAATLPRITQGGITIDASNAGVTLDGSKLQGDSLNGLVINSDHNTVMGLEIVNFSGIGIYLEGGSYNKIGGDRSIGTGPLGQGNLLGSNYVGISILSTSGGNIITGNFIGTDASGAKGAKPIGNWKSGILIEDQQQYHPLANTIGPDNIIAYNGSNNAVEGGDITGGVVMDTVLIPTTITANSIYNNTGPGIVFNVDDPAQIKYSTPPVILYFDLESGIVSGQTYNNTIVEIFSTDTQDGKIYEGTVTADEFGNFSFRKGEALTGPFLTATTWGPGHSTSEFSQPTPALSAIQIALDAIQNEAPLFQTGFDTWDFGSSGGNGRIENGKLVLTSETQDVKVEDLNNYSSDRFAVEFEFRILDADQGNSYCIFNYNNENVGIGESIRSVSATFNPFGLMEMGHYVYPDKFPGFASSRYDILEGTKPNIKVTLIILGEQIAVFANGQLAYTAINPDGTVVYTTYDFQVSNTMCEFDNYKFWDLSGVDFNP